MTANWHNIKPGRSPGSLGGCLSLPGKVAYPEVVSKLKRKSETGRVLSSAIYCDYYLMYPFSHLEHKVSEDAELVHGALTLAMHPGGLYEKGLIHSVRLHE